MTLTTHLVILIFQKMLVELNDCRVATKITKDKQSQLSSSLTLPEPSTFHLLLGCASLQRIGFVVRKVKIKGYNYCIILIYILFIITFHT